MNINSDTVKRLSHYKNILYKLKSLGFEKVFSDNFADALGISSAQVRKDFSTFGITGNKKGGYLVDELLTRSKVILGKNVLQEVIVVGCGKMGMAIMNYNGFSGQGMKIVAGFDSDPRIIDSEAQIPIFDLNDLDQFVNDTAVKVAILTVPEHAVALVYDRMLSAGITGILNFSPVQLKNVENCVIRNINIALELENLFYFIQDKSIK